jgi:hypothetical protein
LRKIRRSDQRKQLDEKGKYGTAWRIQKDGTWKAIHDISNADAK